MGYLQYRRSHHAPVRLASALPSATRNLSACGSGTEFALSFNSFRAWVSHAQCIVRFFACIQLCAMDCMCRGGAPDSPLPMAIPPSHAWWMRKKFEMRRPRIHHTEQSATWLQGRSRKRQEKPACPEHFALLLLAVASYVSCQVNGRRLEGQEDELVQTLFERQREGGRRRGTVEVTGKWAEGSSVMSMSSSPPLQP